MEKLFAAAAAFQNADDAWQAALEKRYGKDAGTMRYLAQGQGMECEDVRAAYAVRCSAMRRYMAMQQD